MPEFTPAELTCPCCRRGFETKLVTSYRIGEKETDFCPRYLDGNPLPNFLHVCPGCGFTGFEADFRTFADPEKIEKVREILSSFRWEEGQPLTGADRYRRAALIGIYSGKSSAQVADLYLQATWCSRMEGEDDDLARTARKKAVKYFELALSAGEFRDEDRPLVHYLLGELHRRLGEFEQAKTHFGRMGEFGEVEPWLVEWRNRQTRLMEK